MIRAVLPEVFPADVLIAGLPFGTIRPAAVVAQEFHLLLQDLRKGFQPVVRPVQPDIRHHTAEFRPVQLPLKKAEFREHLCGGGNKKESGIPLPEIRQQQVRTEDHTVSGGCVPFEQCAQGVAFPVREMLLPEQGIAEGQARGNAVFPHHRRCLFRLRVPEPDAAAAPEAVRRSAVNGADFAPVIKLFPVGAEQREERPVQPLELKQTRKMENRFHTDCPPSCPAVSRFFVLYPDFSTGRGSKERARAISRLTRAVLFPLGVISFALVLSFDFLLYNSTLSVSIQYNNTFRSSNCTIRAIHDILQVSAIGKCIFCHRYTSGGNNNCRRSSSPECLCINADNS